MWLEHYVLEQKYSDNKFLKHKLREVLLEQNMLKQMKLYHPLDGVTNLTYRLLYFLTPNKKIQRERH